MTANILHDFISQLEEFGVRLDKIHRLMGDTNEDSAPHLVEEIHAETLEVIGLQISVLEAARQAKLDMEQHSDRNQTRRQLGICSQAFTQMSARFYERLYTVEHICDLNELKRQRAGKWVRITMNDLIFFHTEIQKIYSLLLDCWRVMAENAAGTPALNSTAISKQYLFPERK